MNLKSAWNRRSFLAALGAITVLIPSYGHDPAVPHRHPVGARLGGGSIRWAFMIASGEVRGNGIAPVNITYNVHPSE